jgi:hypothetical protein
VAFTAGSTGCASPQYEFWVQYPNGKWVNGRTWGVATWSWDTTGLAPGHYTVHVWANNLNDSTATYEALGESLVSLTVCATASLSPTNPSQAAGSTVALSAVSTGCAAPQYEFWVQYPNGSWNLIQGWGGSTTNWDTTRRAPGIYTVHVWANNIGDSTATYETLASSTVSLTGCLSASLSPSSGASPVGTGITFTAGGLGCTSPVYEFWLQWPDATWHLMQPFGSGTSWFWNTTTGYSKGTYRIHVWADNQAADTSTWEVVGEATYTLT